MHKNTNSTDILYILCTGKRQKQSATQSSNFHTSAPDSLQVQVPLEDGNWVATQFATKTETTRLEIETKCKSCRILHGLCSVIHIAHTKATHQVLTQKSLQYGMPVTRWLLSANTHFEEKKPLYQNNMFLFYDNITSPRNMEAAINVASGLQQGFWQHLTCSFHKQFRKNVYSKLADNCVYNSLKKYSKLIIVKQEQCIKWNLQEFDCSPTVLNSVINYLHNSIYDTVIKNHVTVGAATLLHYQKFNQNGFDKCGVGNP